LAIEITQGARRSGLCAFRQGVWNIALGIVCIRNTLFAASKAFTGRLWPTGYFSAGGLGAKPRVGTLARVAPIIRIEHLTRSAKVVVTA